MRNPRTERASPRTLVGGGVLQNPAVLAGTGVALAAAAFLLAVWPTWTFVTALIGRLSGRSVEVNLLSASLVAILSLVAAAYLFPRSWKFLKAARDPIAREELLGEMLPRSRELRYSLHILRKSALAMVGLGIIVVYLGMILVGPYFLPFPYVFSPAEKHVPPGGSAVDTETGNPAAWSSATWANGSFALFADDRYAVSDSTGGDLLLSDLNPILSNITLPESSLGVRDLQIGVEAYSPESHTSTVALSWDSGAAWTQEQTVPFKTSDTDQPWFLSFTADRAWTVADLDVTNFRVRVTHVQGQGAAFGRLYVDDVQVRLTLEGPVHPWGTNELGQDMLTGIVLGGAVDFRVGIIVVALSVAVGVVLGVFSGYLGGTVDEAVMRITDLFLAIPGLILALAIAAMLGRSLENVLIALVVVSWPSYTRLVRGQALSVREASYVEAARSVGAPMRRVVMRHILPNVLSPVIVAATLDLGTIVLATAALSFIGVGAQPYEPEWGIMIARGYGYITSGFWWEYMIPGLAIFFFVLAFNLFGDGFRDIMDPRLRR